MPSGASPKSRYVLHGVGGAATVTGESSVSPPTISPVGIVAEPAHGKSSFTGASLIVTRIHAGPAVGPVRNAGDVCVKQPGGRSIATFFTAHSGTQLLHACMASFQSPS